MRTIPYGRQSIDNADIKAVEDALKSEYLTTGPRVAEFENALAGFVGAKHAVAVNSGTSGLDIAVAALGLPAGSEIVTTPFTFAASANCCLYNNCKPVFADIEKGTHNLDPAQVKKKLTKKTKAIIYVDYAGQPCELGELREIADKHGLYLIEDACHALGGEYEGKRIGSFADMTVFSFHPVKHITTGEGGAVTTENAELYAKLRMLRNHGIDKTPSERTGYLYDMKMLGRNYRITDFQCALGTSQLKKIGGFLKRREEIAKEYGKELAKISGIEAPYVKKNVRHAWHLYTIMLDKGISRDRFFGAMREKGIGVNVHYIPVYRFSYYGKFGIKPSSFPETEDAYSRIVSIPMFSGMSNDDVKEVVAAVRSSLK